MVKRKSSGRVKKKAPSSDKAREYQRNFREKHKMIYVKSEFHERAAKCYAEYVGPLSFGGYIQDLAERELARRESRL